MYTGGDIAHQRTYGTPAIVMFLGFSFFSWGEISWLEKVNARLIDRALKWFTMEFSDLKKRPARNIHSIIVAVICLALNWFPHIFYDTIVFHLFEFQECGKSLERHLSQIPWKSFLLNFPITFANMWSWIDRTLSLLTVWNGMNCFFYKNLLFFEAFPSVGSFVPLSTKVERNKRDYHSCYVRGGHTFAII